MHTCVQIYSHGVLPRDFFPLLDIWRKEVCNGKSPVNKAYPPAWHLLVWAKKEPVSYLAMHQRICQVGKHAIEVSGLGSVMTPKQWRSRGFSTLALQYAYRFMQEHLQAEFGLVVTSEQLAPFYQGRGWQMIDAPLYVREPDGQRALSDQHVLVQPLNSSEWPQGIVDLGGPPW